MKKIINFLLKYGLITVSIIVGILGICSIFITAYFDVLFNLASEVTHFKFSIGIIEIFTVILFSAFLLIFCKKVLNKIPNKYIIIPLLLMLLIIYIVWIYIIRIAPIDDQYKIHEIAADLLNNNISFHLSHSQYLFLFPYQLGIVYFVSIIYKLFGVNFLNMQYFNCVCSVINLYLLYRITKSIFKEEAISKISLLLITGFSLYWMFFNVHIYGNICGLTFSLIATLLIVKYIDIHKNINLLFAGITISIAIILKSNYNIFLCAFIIILVLDLIRDWKVSKLYILSIFIIGYFSISLLYSFIIEKKYNIELNKRCSNDKLYLYGYI